MYADATDHTIVEIGQVEQRDSRTGLEFLAVQRLFEAEATVFALGSVEVDLPQVRTLGGMMTLEAHSRLEVDETRTVSVAAIN